MVDINNPASYKGCTKKRAEFWVCKPPRGTLVFNKLNQYNAWLQYRGRVPQLNKRFYMTAEEVIQLMNKDKQLYSELVRYGSIVNDRMNMVMCGTEGEMWAVPYKHVCQGYLVFNNNSYVNLASVVNDRVVEYKDGKVMDWCRAVNQTTGERLFACHIPVQYKGSILTREGQQLFYNLDGVDHGKGDFILCRNWNGQPNLQDRWVVNGLVFADTYDNRGWTDCITIGRKGITEPVRLWKNMAVKPEAKGEDFVLKWLQRHEFKDAVEFIRKGGFSEKELRPLVIMFNAVDYMVFKVDSQFTLEVDYYGGIDSFNTYLRFKELDDIDIVFYYNGDLYRCDDGAVECEMSYKTKQELDKFIALLGFKETPYSLVKQAIEASGFVDLLKSFKSFTQQDINLLNKSDVCITARQLSIF